MRDNEHLERDPAEGSRSTVDRQLTDSVVKPSENGGVPVETFPPFDDPANSPAPAGYPVKPTAAPPEAPSEDPIYAGHPDFSQEAACNKPPEGGMGLTRPLDETSKGTRQSDAQGPSVASPGEEISEADVTHRPL